MNRLTRWEIAVIVVVVLLLAQDIYRYAVDKNTDAILIRCVGEKRLIVDRGPLKLVFDCNLKDVGL